MNVKITAAAIIGVAALAASYAGLRAQAPPSRTVWDGVYTEEQAKRGEPLYNKNCAECHGETLEGIEMAPALVGGDFLDKWAGETLGDLFERIRATMPKEKPGRLSREINADITAYMLRVNEFPPGKAELPRDTQILKQIRIDATKPEGK
jgi:mono/diheme cytochrome c family protein